MSGVLRAPAWLSMVAGVFALACGGGSGDAANGDGASGGSGACEGLPCLDKCLCQVGDLSACQSVCGGTAGGPGTGGAVGTGGGAGTGGVSAAGGTAGVGGGAGSPGTGGGPQAPAPIIPPVNTECPAFVDGTITFMGLGGIEVVAGAKAPGPTAPMVFYWHGTGSTAGEFNFLASAVRDGVVAEGGVLISFQGTTGGDLSSGTFIFGVSDLDLVDQLVACAVRDHNIDPRRIFTTGCSAGGLFAGAMATLRSNYVAAVAPNSGGWIGVPVFQGPHAPALMSMHGALGADMVVVEFTETSAAANQGFKDHGGFVINCDHGGGHCAAGSFAPDVWRFFNAHPYGVQPEPSPWATGLPPDFNPVCQVF